MNRTPARSPETVSWVSPQGPMSGCALRYRFFAMTLLVFVFTVLCGRCSAQRMPGTGTNWHFGYELFQMLLEENGLNPAEPIEVLENPRESVIVKLGNLHGFMQDREIEEFCVRGGRVLLASDMNYSAGRLGRFNAAPVEAPEAADQYQQYRDCIRLTQLDSEHPLMESVGSLIVNRSGWLTPGLMYRHRWETAARLPNNCTPAISEGRPVLASIDSTFSGEIQMLLAADPSLFTNGMMWHGDNAILAINVSRVLAEGNRTRLLFLVDDRQQASYAESPLLQTSQSPPPLPEAGLDAMLRVANSVVGHVERSNVVNEYLANRPRDLAVPYYRRMILFALTGLAALFIIWKLAAPGPKQQPNMPNREMRSAHDLESGQKLKSSDLGTSASLLARDLCAELTGSTDANVWFRGLGGKSAAGDSLVREKALRKRLTPIVELAVDPRTVHISRSRFESLGRTIIELRQLHRQGLLLKPALTSPSPK